MTRPALALRCVAIPLWIPLLSFGLLAACGGREASPSETSNCLDMTGHYPIDPIDSIDSRI